MGELQGQVPQAGFRKIEKYKLSKIKHVDISLAEENARQMWPY